MCFGGPRAEIDYRKYGMSRKCRDGLGGLYANSVYRLLGKIKLSLFTYLIVKFNTIWDGYQYILWFKIWINSVLRAQLKDSKWDISIGSTELRQPESKTEDRQLESELNIPLLNSFNCVLSTKFFVYFKIVIPEQENNIFYSGVFYIILAARAYI